MVSTKLLPVVSPYTIKPKLRRSIPFGMPAHVYDNGYGYEKLTNESQSLLCAITLYDSFCGGSDEVDDVDFPAAKDNISVAGSISSVLFSVDKDSISSSGECSYSYSLCSNAIRAKGTYAYSPTSTEQCRKVNHGTLDLSGHSGLSSDITFMSRHAGLDYTSRTRPQDSNSTGAPNDVHKMCAQVITTTMDGYATNVATKLRNELEATFSSDDSESSTSDLMAKPLSSEDISFTNKRKASKVGRKWLMKFNRRFSAPARSMNSPAA